KRGRRSIEPQGGTAIDRRRTQNRVAQRAYRRRKELAIEALKQRVLELEKLNEDIGREFVSLTELILRQKFIEYSPEIAKHLQQTTLNILRIARHAEEEEEEEEEELGDSHVEQSHDVEVEENFSTPTPSAGSNSRPPRLPSGCSSTTSGLERLQAHDLPVYDSTAQPAHPTPLISRSNSPPEYHLPNLTLPYTLPGSPSASSLPPPRSYAAHERTFGRRLHRASQEAGFLLASMNSPPPTSYFRVFGFCLHFETREEIRGRMGEAVRQTRDSTLNNWRYPFTNLGGAGLFYPGVNSSTRDGTQAGGELPIGNRALQHEAYRPSELTGFSMGPFSPTVEEVRDLRLSPLLRILDPEFQGDFFDADEIEICLRGYGVIIPPNKDFVTAEIDMAMLESVQDMTPADSHASGLATLGDLSVQQPVPESCSAGVTRMALLSPHSWDHITPSIGKMPSFTDPTLPRDNWERTQVRKTRVTVDVERLITSLTKMTVCLGRTPAVRPKDIRKSLQESLVLADQ
ncbi:hypothetical protein B0J15DRAFT_574199, partial [Fusarium solani]